MVAHTASVVSWRRAGLIVPGLVSYIRQTSGFLLFYSSVVGVVLASQMSLNSAAIQTARLLPLQLDPGEGDNAMRLDGQGSVA